MKRFIVFDLDVDGMFPDNKWGILDIQTNLLITNEEGSVIDYRHLFDAEMAAKELNDPINISVDAVAFLIGGINA